MPKTIARQACRRDHQQSHSGANPNRTFAVIRSGLRASGYAYRPVFAAPVSGSILLEGCIDSPRHAAIVLDLVCFLLRHISAPEQRKSTSGCASASSRRFRLFGPLRAMKSLSAERSPRGVTASNRTKCFMTMLDPPPSSLDNNVA